MYEFVKSLLPKEVLDITDVNHLRDLREYFDDRVQEEKDKKANAEIEQYKPIYEGKYMLGYGYTWDGPVSVPNTADLKIIKVNKINFVGHGFVRAEVVVLNIKYHTPMKELKHGLTADEHGEVTIDTYEDDQYSIPINDDSYMDKARKTKYEPKFLTEDEIKKLIDTAMSRQKEQVEWFKQKVGLKWD